MRDMNFEFATARRIIFGEGKRREIAKIARSLGSRVLVVTGKNQERATWLLNQLKKESCDTAIFPVEGEPTIDVARYGASCAREFGANAVIGVGGGSVIDAGKAIAALATNLGDVLDYVEVIGKAQPLVESPLPYLAVPTTAGTGAEVTRNAVLGSPEHQVKVSLRSAKMLPAVAVIDPELTYELPPDLTAQTGLDALTQLIEPFVCNRANPLTDAICREAIPRVVHALPRVFSERRDKDARREMAFGSLCGGLALANAGLGAVHGFAAPIGGMIDAPHGAICAALLAPVMGMNLAVATQSGRSEIVARYDEVARLVTDSGKAKGTGGVEWIDDLCRTLRVRGLGSFGVKESSFDILAERAERASSMKANPVQLNREQLLTILARAL